MGSIKIHGGDFGRRKLPVRYSLLGRHHLLMSQGLFRRREKIVLSQKIASVRIVDASNFKDGGGSMGAAIGGAFLLGSVGLLAGSAIGGNKREVSFVCEFQDGRQFVATTDRRTFDAYFMGHVGITPPASAEAQQAA